jgi:hypothetical protein
MADSFRSELRDIIERVYINDLGGRATQKMVHAGVWRDLPEHLTDYLIGKGIASEVQTYFRSKGSDGLPKFPEVNADGEHHQLEFLSVTEFAFVHSKYVDRASANNEQADKIRQLCLDKYGVDLGAKASA